MKVEGQNFDNSHQIYRQAANLGHETHCLDKSHALEIRIKVSIEKILTFIYLNFESFVNAQSEISYYYILVPNFLT